MTLDDLLFQGDIFRPERDAGGDRVMVNRRGRYNPYNRWNTADGIVHLTHPANSLQAEIHLAADATTLRVDGSGNLLTDDTRLICCAGYGSPNRSSDPSIGGRINALVRAGAAVTIDDPVGLYIGDIDLSSVELPDGGDPAACWHVLRGRADTRMILRAEFAPPSGAGYSLEEVLVGGEPLRFGSQLAELITMVIHGRARPGNGAAPQDGCGFRCCQVPSAPVLLDLADAGTACPPVDPVPRGDLAPAGALATLAVAQPMSMAASDLPDPTRRA